MQAAIETGPPGSVAIDLDPEAALAMAASIGFPARFHEGIVLLAGVVKTGLQHDEMQLVRRNRCQ